LQDRGINAQAINFGAQDENKQSLLSKMTMESAQAVKDRTVRIHPSQRELLAQLRSIEFNDKGHPDKKKMSFDLGDAFMMSIHKIKTGKIIIIKAGNSLTGQVLELVCLECRYGTHKQESHRFMYDSETMRQIECQCKECLK